MKDKICKLIVYAILGIAFFTILFPNYSLGTDVQEESQTQVETSSENIESETQTNTDTMQVGDSSSDGEVVMYTIEDIIFNRIPILDINFFSDKAGGQDVAEDSVVAIMKNIIVTWYVSIRNLVIIGLAIVIIYVGIRMALSTIPEGKAKYKRMLIGWVQALVIVFTIHFVMILVININEQLVNIFEQAEINYINTITEGGEDTIYETIRTRAYDIRFSIGIPATIIYIVLVVIWVKFLFVYFKRMFTIFLLIVIAPFIGAKYAVDSASGKKGSSFSSWLYDFVLNVLIQTVHALVYTTLVSTVLNFALESLAGFIIMLMFMNFMLKADELFRDIFNFGKSALVKDTAKVEEIKDIKESLAGGLFAWQIARTSTRMVKDFAKGTKKTVKGVYKDVSRYNPNVKTGVESGLNRIDEDLEKMFDPSRVKVDEDANNVKAFMQNARLSFNKKIYNSAKIRRLSRQPGSLGLKAKRLKKKLKSHRKKRYTANFKLIKGATLGVAGVILAVPIAVTNPSVGLSVFNTSRGLIKAVPEKDNNDKPKRKIVGFYRKHSKTYKKYYARKADTKKYIKKRDKIYNQIKQLDEIDTQEKEIRNRYAQVKDRDDVRDEDINRFKTMAGKLTVEANSNKIDEIIDEYLENNNITTIDNYAIGDIIDNVVSQIGRNVEIDNTTRNDISDRVKTAMIDKMNNDRTNTQRPYKFDKKDISSKIEDTFIERTMDNKFTDITKEAMSLEKKIDKLEKSLDTNYPHANKFIENL